MGWFNGLNILERFGLSDEAAKACNKLILKRYPTRHLIAIFGDIVIPYHPL